MGLALVKLYAEHILPPGTKVNIFPIHMFVQWVVLHDFHWLQDVVTELVSNVMNGLRQRMMDNNWLDEFTKHLTIEKVNHAHI